MSAPPSFVLRFQSPEDYPSIGRFADDDFELNRVIQPGKEEWEMFYEEEDLKEELPEEVLVKDAEYYKKKRKQRRTYRRKKHLMLQSLTNRNLFEARPIALDSAEEEYYARITKNFISGNKEIAQSTNNSSSGTQFRNVLMKFVKIEGTNQSEIQVIPVADQYLFRKCIRQPDRLLHEIDAESAHEAKILSKRAEAYKRLMHTEDNKIDENGEPVKRRRAKEAVDGAEDGFTYALNRAMRKRAGKNAKRATPTSFLTDSGVDMDEIRENNYFFGNDSSVRYQDDEEDNIHEIQKNDTSYEEREREDDFRLEALDELEQPEDDYDLDDDEEDDDVANALNIPGASELSPAELRRLQQEKLASERESAVLKGTENLSQAMLREAEAMRRQMLEKNAALGLTKPPSNLSSSNLAVSSASAAAIPPLPAASAPTKSTLKRPRDETSSSPLNTVASSASIAEDVNKLGNEAVSDEQRSNKVPRARFAQDATSSVVQFHTAEPSIAITANNAPAAAGSNILSEEIVRQYILGEGGRVEVKKLVKHFKSAQQRYAEVVGDDKVARQLFMDILGNITITIEDSERGLCLVLR